MVGNLHTGLPGDLSYSEQIMYNRLSYCYPMSLLNLKTKIMQCYRKNGPEVDVKKCKEDLKTITTGALRSGKSLGLLI